MDAHYFDFSTAEDAKMFLVDGLADYTGQAADEDKLVALPVTFSELAVVGERCHECSRNAIAQIDIIVGDPTLACGEHLTATIVRSSHGLVPASLVTLVEA